MSIDTSKILETEQITITIVSQNLGDNERILDIGGGGEGIISKIYKEKVVAIDNRIDELNEIIETLSLKIVMDATKLDFINDQFERATAFFSFMYMSDLEIKSAVREVYRVLKDNGVFEIWDIEMPSISDTEKDTFIAQLDIKYEDKAVTTGYGVQLKVEHNSSYISDLLIKSGFKIEQLVLNENGSFYIEVKK